MKKGMLTKQKPTSKIAGIRWPSYLYGFCLICFVFFIIADKIINEFFKLDCNQSMRHMVEKFSDHAVAERVINNHRKTA